MIEKVLPVQDNAIHEGFFFMSILCIVLQMNIKKIKLHNACAGLEKLTSLRK